MSNLYHWGEDVVSAAAESNMHEWVDERDVCKVVTSAWDFVTFLADSEAQKLVKGKWNGSTPQP